MTDQQASGLRGLREFDNANAGKASGDARRVVGRAIARDDDIRFALGVISEKRTQGARDARRFVVGRNATEPAGRLTRGQSRAGSASLT